MQPKRCKWCYFFKLNASVRVIVKKKQCQTNSEIVEDWRNHYELLERREVKSVKRPPFPPPSPFSGSEPGC